MVFQATILPEGAKETRSWYIGANVAGKRVEPMFYFGGVGNYFGACQKEIADGFPGYEFDKSVAAAA